MFQTTNQQRIMRYTPVQELDTPAGRICPQPGAASPGQKAHAAQPGPRAHADLQAEGGEQVAIGDLPEETMGKPWENDGKP